MNINDYFESFPSLSLGKYVLREMHPVDYDALATLFSDLDTRKYYKVLPEHEEDHRLFFAFLQNKYIERNQITWVIAQTENQRIVVGFITIEFKVDNNVRFGEISYVVDTNQRHRGIASDALNAVSRLFEDCFLGYLMADISVDNKASERVIEKNHFSKLNGIAFFDNTYPDWALRFKWKRDVLGARHYLYALANYYYDNKKYDICLQIYDSVLREPYNEGSELTDAQTFSNIGMCFSCMGKYEEAYKYIVLTKENGLWNTSLERELNWLKTNHPYLMLQK